jgi:hypothetical protein
MALENGACNSPVTYGQIEYLFSIIVRTLKVIGKDLALY